MLKVKSEICVLRYTIACLIGNKNMFLSISAILQVLAL